MKYYIPCEDIFLTMISQTDFLNKLMKYTSVMIVPNNDTESYSNLEKIPKEKKEFQEQFKVIQEKHPCGVVICHAIITDEMIRNIKFNHPEFFNYLKKNKIYLSQDKFERQEVVSVGFLTHIHPTVANQDILNEELSKIIKETIETNDKGINECKKDTIPNQPAIQVKFELIPKNETACCVKWGEP